MLTWAAIVGAITAVAGLGTWAVKYMLDRSARKRDLEQQELGRKDERLANTKDALARVDAANEAAKAVKNDPASIAADPDNLATHPER